MKILFITSSLNTGDGWGRYSNSLVTELAKDNETFVISKEGRIVYRHIGLIDQETWDKVLSPLIKKLNAWTMKIYLTLIFILLFNTTAFSAVAENYPFTSTEDNSRFQTLIQTTRCVVCQNQNIADSNAPLAADLRQKIYEMVLAKQPDSVIQAYLTKRYGDFILLKPRFSALTLVLWLFPFIGLFSIIVILSMIHHRSKWTRTNKTSTMLQYSLKTNKKGIECNRFLPLT